MKARRVESRVCGGSYAQENTLAKSITVENINSRKLYPVAPKAAAVRGGMAKDTQYLTEEREFDNLFSCSIELLNFYCWGSGQGSQPTPGVTECFWALVMLTSA